MDLSDYFFEIAATYDRRDGLGTDTQRMLSGAPALLAEHIPAGLIVRGSGGKGVATLTPWVGLFDPDETDNPQRGGYVVYIFSQDIEVLVLSLHQGMEELRSELGDAGARQRLQVDAAAIRAAMPAESLAGFTDQIDLRSKGSRQQAYEAGNIACRAYSVGALPSEAHMRDHLAAMTTLYADAVATKRRLLLTKPGAIASPSDVQHRFRDNTLAGFRPKNDGDYVAHLRGRVINKSRRHETIVAQFGQVARERGFTPTTEHPQDLVLRRDGSTYLIEVKVVYNSCSPIATSCTTPQPRPASSHCSASASATSTCVSSRRTTSQASGGRAALGGVRRWPKAGSSRGTSDSWPTRELHRIRSTPAHDVLDVPGGPRVPCGVSVRQS